MRQPVSSSLRLGVVFALSASCLLAACDRNVSPSPSTTPGTVPGTTDPADQRRNDSSVPPGMQPAPGSPGSPSSNPSMPSEPPASAPTPGGSGTSPSQ
jgi:hypothetical protein